MKFSFIFTKMACIHFNSCLSSFNATPQRLQLVCTETNPDKQNANRIHTQPNAQKTIRTKRRQSKMKKWINFMGCFRLAVWWNKSWFLWLTKIIHRPFIYECPDIPGTNWHALHILSSTLTAVLMLRDINNWYWNEMFRSTLSTFNYSQ